MQLVIRQDADPRRSHVVNRPHWEKESCLTVTDDLGNPSNIGGNDRCSTRHGFQSGKTEGLRLGWQQEEVRTRQELLHRLMLTEEHHLLREPELRGALGGARPVGTIPDHDQAGIDRLLHAGKNIDDIFSSFHRPEIGDMHHDLLPSRSERGSVAGFAPRTPGLGVDEIRDDLNPFPWHREVPHSFVSQVAGHGGDSVRFEDREPRNRVERRMQANERDVRAVKCRDDLQRPFVGEHLFRQIGRSGVWNRIVHVDEIELMFPRGVMQCDRERERVGGMFKKRVVPHFHFMEEYSLAEPTEPKRLIIRDEMDLVAPFGECESQFRGDRARAAVGRIAGDANLQVNSGSVSELSISG